MLFPTTLVGSYPQPEWLIDRKKLAGRFPPRVRARELWRVPEPFLAEAQEDATIMAIKAQESAGLDIITDGEIRRESYSNRFATALDGVDLDNPGTRARSQRSSQSGAARGRARSGAATPVEVGDLRVPAPAHTAPRQGHGARTVHDGAAGADRLLRRQPAAGRDGLRGRRQRRDPRSVRCRRRRRADRRTLHAGASRGSARVRPAGAQSRARGHQRHHRGAHLFRLRGDHSLRGLRATRSCRSWPSARCRQVSIETAQSNLDCAVLKGLPGKKIILGVIDLSTNEVETPELVAARIRRALPFVEAADVIVAPDCGMKYLPRDVAFGKLQAMVGGRADRPFATRTRAGPRRRARDVSITVIGGSL